MHSVALPRFLTYVLAIAFLFAASVPASPTLGQDGDQLAVMLNARNPSRTVTAAQLRSILQGTTAFWHGVVPIRVFIRGASSPAGEAMFQLIGMTPHRFAEHWQARQLAGQGVAPVTVPSVERLVTEVGRSPGAVGIMLASEAWSLRDANGVRVVPVE